MSNFNPVVSNVAASDLSGKENQAVKLTSTGLDIAGASDAIVGTLMRGGAATKGVDVFLSAGYGLHYIKIGNATAIAMGDELEQSALGTYVKRVGGPAAGQAWEAAGATSTNGFIRALLFSKGGAPVAPVTVYAADGAIVPASGSNVLTKGSAGAYTLAAPVAAQEGSRIVLTSGSAFAHVVTATGLLNDGVAGGSKNAATFAAFIGASMELIAYNLKWHTVSLKAVTVA